MGLGIYFDQWISFMKTIDVHSLFLLIKSPYSLQMIYSLNFYGFNKRYVVPGHPKECFKWIAREQESLPVRTRSPYDFTSKPKRRHFITHSKSRDHSRAIPLWTLVPGRWESLDPIGQNENWNFYPADIREIGAKVTLKSLNTIQTCRSWVLPKQES